MRTSLSRKQTANYPNQPPGLKRAMTLIEWLTGNVSKASFADKFMAELRAGGQQDLEFDAAQFAIRCNVGTSADMVFLANFYAEYCLKPRLQRGAALRHMASAYTQEKQYFDANTPSTETLLPIVRDRANRWFTQAQLRRNNPSGEFESTDQPIGGDLAASLVLDSPTAMRYVGAKDLNTLNMQFADALVEAVHNLRAITPDKWRQIGPLAYAGAWGDTYDCSRILLPDVIYRLGLPGRPVALTPCRGVLLVSSDASREGQLAILAAAQSAAENTPRWTSAEMLVLDEGRWETFVPTDPAVFQMQKNLDTRMRKSTYDQQKTLLDEALTAAGRDIFVANYMAFEKDQQAFSIATWSEGVEAYLPRADNIVFVRPDAGAEAGQASSVMVDWAIAHGLLEAEMILVPDVVPERFHVHGFPSEDVLEQFRLHKAAST